MSDRGVTYDTLGDMVRVDRSHRKRTRRERAAVPRSTAFCLNGLESHRRVASDTVLATIAGVLGPDLGALPAAGRSSEEVQQLRCLAPGTVEPFRRLASRSVGPEAIRWPVPDDPELEGLE